MNIAFGNYVSKKTFNFPKKKRDLVFLAIVMYVVFLTHPFSSVFMRALCKTDKMNFFPRNCEMAID